VQTALFLNAKTNNSIARGEMQSEGKSALQYAQPAIVKKLPLTKVMAQSDIFGNL
jgi:hypothetical protein